MDFIIRFLSPRSKVRSCELSLNKERPNEQIEDQINADLSFFLQKGNHPQRICFPRTNCQPSFFYKDVFEMLRKRVIRVRPDISHKWMLHHDNAPCHTTLSLQNFLPQKAFLWFPSPLFTWPQSLWLFSIFLNLKMSSKDVISWL